MPTLRAARIHRRAGAEETSQPIGDGLHRENGRCATAGKSIQQQRGSGIGQRPAFAQHGRERFGVAEAEIHALAGQRMDAMRRVADERHSMRDHRGQLLQREREPCAGRDRFERAERVAPAGCDALRERVRRQSEELARECVGRGPHHRHPAPGQRKPGEDPAVVVKPLERPPEVRMLAGEIGDHRRLPVGLRRRRRCRRRRARASEGRRRRRRGGPRAWCHRHRRACRCPDSTSASRTARERGPPHRPPAPHGRERRAAPAPRRSRRARVRRARTPRSEGGRRHRP